MALINCAGQPDSVLIDRSDAWAVSPEAWRTHTGIPAGRVTLAHRRRVEQRERVRWIPVSDGVRVALREARTTAGISPHRLGELLGQRNGFVWDIEHGFHFSVDPDVYALWLDICQPAEAAVPA